MENRTSTFSNFSSLSAPRSTAQQSTQVSTTTLLNNLHNAYSLGQPCTLDASTTLVVNTWLNSGYNGTSPTIDVEMLRSALENARLRAEDGCIALCSLHQSAPSCLIPMISAVPITVPSSLYTALSVLRPFTCHVTPFNASYARHSALAVTFNLSDAGTITGAVVRLSTSGIYTTTGFLNIPAESGYRAFDVFYYLLTAASTPAEREFLSLKSTAAYAVLNRSRTLDPPSHLPAADDAAAAEDFRTSLKEIGIKGGAHRNLLSILAALLKLGDTLGFLIDGEDLDDTCEEVADLLGLEPEIIARKCSTDDRGVLISGLYECLVDWIIAKANEAIHEEVQAIRETASSDGILTPGTDDDDSVSLSIVEIPSQDLGKAIALRNVFEDASGINSEMKEDGVEVVAAGASVLKEMSNAVNEVSAHLGSTTSSQGREREYELDRREGVLDKVGVEADQDAFIGLFYIPFKAKVSLLANMEDSNWPYF